MSAPLVAPNFQLDGKRALVTGGSRGIGLASAFALARAGAQVVIAARDQAGLAHAKDSLAKQGAMVQTVVLDVTDAQAVQATIAGLEPFSVLVNNAGGNRPGTLAEVSAADIEAVLRLNVATTLWVTQQVTAAMIKAGLGGSIINLSSQFGHIGASERTLYSAAKHGVEGLTKALAWEVGRYGIRVNAIAPSLIETDMTRERLAQPGVRESFAAKSALGRIGQPHDISGAVVFLASDASAYVTGSSLRVDGGTTAA